MTYEDVGLRATIANVAGYQRDVQKVNAGMNSIGDTATKTATKSAALGSAFGGILKTAIATSAAIAAAFAARSVIGGIGDTIKAASDLNESINKVNVVLGESAKTVIDWSKTTARAIGQSQQEALEATGTFANLFLTMGLGQKDAADMAMNITELASDIASFNNIDPSIALEKLRSGLVGEVEPLRTVGILLNETTMKAKAMQLGIYSGKGELTEAAKVQARYALILEQSATAQGDFSRTSNDIANSNRITAASWKDIQTQLGQKLLPVVKTFTVLFAKFLPQAFATIEPFIDRFLGGIGDVSKAFAPILPIVQGVARAFLDFAGRGGGAVLSILKQVAEVVLRSYPHFALIGRIWRELSDSGVTMGGAMSGLKVVLDGIAGALESVADPAGVVMSTFRQIGAVVEAAVNTIADMALPVLEGIWDKMVEGWLEIEPLIRPALESIAKVVQVVLGQIAVFWEENGANILATVRGVWEAVGSIIQGALSILTAIIKPILRAIAGDWTSAWEDIKQIPGVAFEAILDVVKRLGTLLFRLMKTIVQALRLEDAWYGLRDFILKLWSDIVNGIKSRINKAIDEYNGLIEGLNKVMKALRLPEIAFRIPKLNIEEFIPPPRPGWFADIASDDMLKFDENIKRATASYTQMATEVSQPIETGADEAAQQVAQIARVAPAVGSAMKSGTDAAKAAIKSLEGDVKDLEDALKAAQDAMRGFADPRLTGMQGAEDELFELDMAIKRARLAELGLGDEASKAAKDVVDAAEDMTGGFDELAAQQRELAEGIPVPFQKAMQEIEQAQREAAKEGVKGIAAEPAEEMSEVERLQRLKEAKELMRDLAYEPQLRKLRETFETLTGANKEITFEQAMMGLIGSHAEATKLSEELAVQNAILSVAKAAMEEEKEAAAAIGATRADTSLVEQEISQSLDLQTAALQSQVELYASLQETEEARAKSIRDQLAAYKEQAAVAATQQAALAKAPWLSETELPTVPGLQTGGKVMQSGQVDVGEHGRERLALPVGTTVMPSHAIGAAQVSRSYQDTWNISGVSQPVNVANEVAKYMAWKRMTGGR